MRWIPYLIVLYLVLLVQVSLGQVLMFKTEFMGSIWPDLMAMLAFYVAISAPRQTEALMGAWTAGFAADLLAGQAVAVGPMAIMFAVAGFMVFRVRDTFFADRFGARMLLGFIFCLVSHLGWVIIQSLVSLSWSGFGTWLLQAIGISIYTGILVPFVCILFDSTKRVIVQPAKRRHY